MRLSRFTWGDRYSFGLSGPSTLCDWPVAEGWSELQSFASKALVLSNIQRNQHAANDVAD
jgi:hypothetical protein